MRKAPEDATMIQGSPLVNAFNALTRSAVLSIEEIEYITANDSSLGNNKTGTSGNKLTRSSNNSFCCLCLGSMTKYCCG